MRSIIQNRKGLSEVVSMTVFILLSVVSVFIIYQSVRALADKTEAELSPIASCLELQTIPSLIDSAVYNEQTQDLQVTIKRTILDGDAGQFTFVVDTPSASKKYECGPSCGGSCVLQDLGNTKMFYIFSEEKPTKVTLYALETCEISSRNVN